MTLFNIIKNVNEPKLHFFSTTNIPFSSSYYYFLNRDINYLKQNYSNLSYYHSIIHSYSLLDRINPNTLKKTKKRNYFLYYELMNIFSIHKIQFTDNIKVNTYNSFSSSPILFSIFENQPIIPFSFLTFTQNTFAIKYFIQKQVPNLYHTICNNIFCKKKIISLLKTSFQKKFDILIFELSSKDYKKENISFCLLIILYFILFHQNQSNQSMFIFKIRNITPLLSQFIHILTFVFDSCCIVNSTIYDKYKNEKYLICKKLNANVDLFKKYQQKIKRNIIQENNITSFLYNPPSIYFMNHINEINNLMGQEQLLFLEHFIHFFQSTQLKEKIKLLKINQREKCNSFIQLL
jgi:hypothetical protein